MNQGGLVALRLKLIRNSKFMETNPITKNKVATSLILRKKEKKHLYLKNFNHAFIEFISSQ